MSGCTNLSVKEDPSEPGQIAAGSSLALGSRVASSDHVALERNRLLNPGHLSEVSVTIMASRKAATRCIYDTSWKAFAKQCGPLNPLVGLLTRGHPSKAENVYPSSPGSYSHDPTSDSWSSLTQTSSYCLLFQRGCPSSRLYIVPLALTKPPFELLREVPLKRLYIKTLLMVVTSARDCHNWASCQPGKAFVSSTRTRWYSGQTSPLFKK